eukprot:s885_g1.t1
MLLEALRISRALVVVNMLLHTIFFLSLTLINGSGEYGPSPGSQVLLVIGSVQQFPVKKWLGLVVLCINYSQVLSQMVSKKANAEYKLVQAEVVKVKMEKRVLDAEQEARAGEAKEALAQAELADDRRMAAEANARMVEKMHDAMQNLLLMLCDAVVELDNELRILDQGKLGLVLYQHQKDLAARPFSEFLVNEDVQRFTDMVQTSNRQRVPVSVTMIGSYSMKIRMTVYLSQIDQPDGSCTYVVGICESQDETKRSDSIERIDSDHLDLVRTRFQSFDADAPDIDYFGAKDSESPSTPSAPMGGCIRSSRYEAIQPMLEEERMQSLLPLLWSWPVPSERSGCCETHRLLDEAASVVEKLKGLECQAAPGCLVWQCPGCKLKGVPGDRDLFSASLGVCGRCPTLLSPRVPMVQPAAKAAGRSIPVRQVGSVAAPPGAPRRTALGQGDGRLRSSKSQDPRPATARAVSPPRQASPRPAPRRTGQSLTAPPGRAAAVTPAPPAQSARGGRERSLGSSQRNLARPQTARAARPQSARRTQTPTARPQSVRRSDGDTLGRSQSRVSPRPARSSSTTLSSRGLGTSKSASQLVRTGSGTPGSPAPAMDLPSVEELKRMIAETKKEVREIRAVESKTKWQVNREERKDKLAQTIATQSELREWRWKQAEGMKALAVQRVQEARVNDLQELVGGGKNSTLQESKDFLKFKREAKLRTKEEELQLQTEVYHDRKKDSAWNVARAQEAVEQEQALVREKVDHVQQLREEKKQRVEKEKVTAAQERALQEHLDVAHLARQLAAEKERLLENLQFSRSCLQAPLRRR